MHYADYEYTLFQTKYRYIQRQCAYYCQVNILYKHYYVLKLWGNMRDLLNIFLCAERGAGPGGGDEIQGLYSSKTGTERKRKLCQRNMHTSIMLITNIHYFRQNIGTFSANTPTIVR